MMTRKKSLIIYASVIAAAAIIIQFISPEKAKPAADIFAGTGKAGFENGECTKAQFNHPSSLAIMHDGSIIIADTNNNLIRIIKGNLVNTVAGKAKTGAYVDGNALKACFNKPRGIACDSDGGIYVSDTENNAIRKIINSQVFTIAKNNSDTKSTFNKPLGICIDDNRTLYVADSLNNEIKSISPSGEVSTFAGFGGEAGGFCDGHRLNARFNEPSAITIDNENNLYVLDSGNQVIRKISNNKVTTLTNTKYSNSIPGTAYMEGGFRDGNITQARFNFPKGLSLGPSGSLLVADTWNNKIRKVNVKGKNVETILEGESIKDTDGLIPLGSLNMPMSIAYKSNKIYIADTMNNCIKVLPFSNLK